jgi:hypothetical protein
MHRYGITDLVKFLLGILLIQLATAIQVLAGLRAQDRELWVLFALLSLTLGGIAALWFTSLTNHARRDAVARLKDDFSREREKIRLRAEREKTKVIEKSHQQIIRHRARSQSKAKMKASASFAGLLALGGIMLFTQFFTLGMLLVTTTGGALAGYGFRARQEYLGRRRNPEINADKPQSQTWDRSARRVVQSLTGPKGDSG